MALFASPHYIAIELLQFRTQEMRVDIPVGSFAADVGQSDLAAVTCFLIRERDEPVSIDADDSFRDLVQETSQTLIPYIVIPATVTASIYWRVDVGGDGVGHEEKPIVRDLGPLEEMTLFEHMDQ